MALDIATWLSQPDSGLEELEEPCGLFTSGSESQRKPIPLRRRDIAATVFVDGKFADTKELLSYVSDVDCSAVFRFPLPPRAAVYRFRAVIGDREVITKVKPRSEAREEYELAVQQGHTAVHLSQHERGASVFEVSLGNLLAHEEAVVEFSYLRLLDSFGSTTLEWVHTATWVPPYMDSAGDTAAGIDKVASTMPVFTKKVNYKLSYEVTILAPPGVVQSVESPQPNVKIGIPSPANKPAAAAGVAARAGTAASSGLDRWRVSQSADVADPSRDLRLTIELDPAASGLTHSRLLVQRTPAARGGPQRTLVLATLTPPPPQPQPTASAAGSAPPKNLQAARTSTGQVPAGSQGTAPSSAASPLLKEIWFVVDCSGSMSGQPIEQARQAALLFVRDLPAASGVKFNVTCFGSRHRSLYGDGCHLYDAASEAAAVAWIQRHVHADMGGTEILETLQHIYTSPVSPGYTREVIFLTDGGISGNEEQRVYDLVSGPRDRTGPGTGAVPQPAPASAPSTASLTHVFCLGIGEGVHRGLLDGMATRSHGLAAYVGEDEPIAAKTAFLKRAATVAGAALRPRLMARGALVRAAPHLLPKRLFPGEPLHVLLEVVNCEPDATLEVTAEYDNGQGPMMVTLPLGAAVTGTAGSSGSGGTLAGGGDDAAGGGASASSMGSLEDGETLALLHAMAYIDSLLSGTSQLHVRPDGKTVSPPPSESLVKDAVVRLAVQENLVTPYTSAVGVSLRRDPADPFAATNIVEVPLQVPHGRGHWGTAPSIPSTPNPAVYAMRAGGPCGAPAATPQLPPGSHGQGARLGMAMLTSVGLDGAAEPTMYDSLPARGSAQAYPSARSGITNGHSYSRPCISRASGSRSRSPGAYRLGSPYSSGEFECQPPHLAWGAARGAARAPAVDDLDEGIDDEGLAWADESEPVFGAAVPVGSAGGASRPRRALQGSELLAFLNLGRTTEGHWRASTDLATALGLPLRALIAVAAAETFATEPHPVAAARPPALAASSYDDLWATVVALAALRKGLSAQRAVWADMEAKALTWLERRWPAGQGVRSVGTTVLTVVRLLP